MSFDQVIASGKTEARGQAPDPAARIVKADLHELHIPFDDGSNGYDAPPGRWSHFDCALVQITTADGVSGWGECFAYACRGAVAEAFRTMVAPLLIGQDADDVPGLMRRVQQKLHLFGRYGITMFAISGADIALWDRRARAAGQSLAAHLGARRRSEVPAYASLVHYGAPRLVRHMAEQAVKEGYGSVKLHETTAESIRAGREGAGAKTHLTVDANCAWSLDEARSLLPVFREAGLGWLEEPIFPPEDFDALASLADAGIPLSAGENACTRYEFHRMMASGGVAFPQPSVTKIGGVTEFVAVLKEAAKRGITCMPHSPYFGPGYWATLQLLAVAPGSPLLEYLYVRPSAFPGIDTPSPRGGRIAIPDGPGTGFTPDWDVIREFAPR